MNLFMLAQETAGESGLPAWAEGFVISAIKVIIILVLAYIVAGLAASWVTGASKRARIEDTLAMFFGKLTKWAILIMAVISVITEFGVQTTSFAAVIGASALAVGLAFQGTLGNFAAGVMLLTFRPFKVGDAVNVNGVTALVDEIDIFNTTFDTFDNRRIIMPNGSVFGSTIENISYHSERRCDVSVGVDYSADIDKTREVLEKAAASLDNVIEGEGRGTQVVLGDLGDSSVGWTVRAWVPAADFWPTKQALTRAVKMHLDEAGIGIPFPQMDVHLDKADA